VAIKVLIVDDSALMRRQLRQMLESAGGFEIQLARDGKEAIELNQSFKPDVISLDINMPEMDGLTALAYIMAERPVPVIMVSSLTAEGAMATFEALALGAVDFICKPGGTISLSLKEIEKEIISKIRLGARARLYDKQKGKTAKERLHNLSKEKGEETKFRRRGISAQRITTHSGLVIIGVSTGGPSCLEEILPELPGDFPFPVIVAQHMPGTFTSTFAKRLDKICNLPVVEANKLMPLEACTIYVAKGGADVVIVNRSGSIMIQPKPESPNYLWHPSVELLGRSVLEHYNQTENVIGVMLTGMGFTMVLPSNKIAGQVVRWSREILRENT